MAAVKLMSEGFKPDRDIIFFYSGDAEQMLQADTVGAGVDIGSGKGFALYAEVRLNFVTTDPKTTAQVPVGIVGLTF